MIAKFAYFLYVYELRSYSFSTGTVKWDGNFIKLFKRWWLLDGWICILHGRFCRSSHRCTRSVRVHLYARPRRQHSSMILPRYVWFHCCFQMIQMIWSREKHKVKLPVEKMHSTKLSGIWNRRRRCCRSRSWASLLLNRYQKQRREQRKQPKQWWNSSIFFVELNVLISWKSTLSTDYNTIATR